MKSAKTKSVIHLEERVYNTNRKFGSELTYFPAFIVTLDGSMKPALFTENQLQVAMDRAAKNMEDVAKLKPRDDGSFFKKLLSIFG